jgi:hypothetical protein
MNKFGPPSNHLRPVRLQQAQMASAARSYFAQQNRQKELAQQQDTKRRLATGYPPRRDEPKVLQLHPPSPPTVSTKVDGAPTLSFATTGYLGGYSVFCAPMSPGEYGDDNQPVFVAPISVETTGSDVLGFAAQANFIQSGEPMFVARANAVVPGEKRFLRARKPSQHFFQTKPSVVLGRKGQWHALWFPRKPTNVMSFDATGWPLFVAFAEHEASDGKPAYVSEVNATSQDGEPLFIGPQVYVGRDGIETLFCARPNTIGIEGKQLFIHYANFQLNGQPACVLPFNFSTLAGISKMPTKADPLPLKRSSTAG